MISLMSFFVFFVFSSPCPVYPSCSWEWRGRHPVAAAVWRWSPPSWPAPTCSRCSRSDWSGNTCSRKGRWTPLCTESQTLTAPAAWCSRTPVCKYLHLGKGSKQKKMKRVENRENKWNRGKIIFFTKLLRIMPETLKNQAGNLDTF